jgi:hypothetical protein
MKLVVYSSQTRGFDDQIFVVRTVNRECSISSRRDSTTSLFWKPQLCLGVNTRRKYAAASSTTFTGPPLRNGPPRISLLWPYSSELTLSQQLRRKRSSVNTFRHSLTQPPSSRRRVRHPDGGKRELKPQSIRLDVDPQARHGDWAMQRASTCPPRQRLAPTAARDKSSARGRTMTSGGSGNEHRPRREYNRRCEGRYDRSEDWS